MNKKNKVIICFLFFPLLLIFILNIIPVFLAIFYSFTDWNGYSKHFDFIGFDNYKHLLDKENLDVFINSFYYLLSGLFQLIVGTYLALFVYFKKRYKSFYIFLFSLPIFINSIAIGIMFLEFFQPNGSFDVILNSLPIIDYNSTVESIKWIGNKDIVGFVLGFISFWRYTPYTFLLVYIGLNSINENLIKSAKVQGASNYHISKYILIPNIKTTYTMVISMIIVGAFTAYEIPMVVTGGANGTQTFLMRINELAFVSRNYGEASVLTIFMIVFIFIVLLLILNLWRDDA